MAAAAVAWEIKGRTRVGNETARLVAVSLKLLIFGRLVDKPSEPSQAVGNNLYFRRLSDKSYDIRLSPTFYLTAIRNNLYVQRLLDVVGDKLMSDGFLDDHQI